VTKRLLPSLSKILGPKLGSACKQPSDREIMSQSSAAYASKVNRQWLGALQAVETMLLESLEEFDFETPKGLLLSGPVPVLSHVQLVKKLKTGVFSLDRSFGSVPFQLPPADYGSNLPAKPQLWQFPISPTDPLAGELFCLILTPKFSIVLVLGTSDRGLPTFSFSFAPEDIEAVWQGLQERIELVNRDFLEEFANSWQKYAPKPPDYRQVTEFSRLLLEYMPQEADNLERHYLPSDRETVSRHAERNNLKPSLPPYALDLELLQALTHEIRTPLATIKTLTQLLMKRQDLAPEVVKRLEAIEYECFQQINRMELIFRAVELAASGFADTHLVHLTSTSLKQLLEQNVPRWQKQALRHNVTLDVILPPKMPAVVSHPVMLEQVLTGLMETFTRRLPAGGKIQVHVTPAGDRLKLQFQSHPHPSESGATKAPKLQAKSLGQLLIFQPETGSISLNLNVTKNLCQILGGKLILRERPATGEELTIFLPLEMSRSTADFPTT
jgi:signal transduction histidine kinase